LAAKGFISKAEARKIVKEIDDNWRLREKYDPYLRNIIKERGYDSVVYKNTQEAAGDSYIAFEPSQIKSATGNRGTFDPDNPNILYQSSESEVLKRFREVTAKARAGEAKRLEQSISDLERRIDEKDFTPKGRPQPRAVTAEVARLRARRDELRAEYDKLKGSTPKQGPKLSEASRSGLPVQGPKPSDARRLPAEGPRLTEAPLPGPKMSEAKREGPRLSEGKGRKEGPRPSEAPVQGPRLGDSRKEGPRLSEGKGRGEGPRLSEAVGPKEGPKVSEMGPKLGPKQEEYRKPTFKEQLADVANVPRSLKSSIDLSAAMRQGAMFTLTHPAKAARIFFGSQLKSLSNKGYESFKTTLAADPDVKLMKDSGLHLTSLADGKITNREEAFASKLAGKVPLVKRTENAYVTFLDAARSEWFKQLKGQAEDAATKAKRPVTKAQYEAIARFVNRATGRGDLGKGAINDAAPLLNSMFFAPRYAVSKLQVLDPRTYSQLPPGARRQAVRQAVQYFATVGATAALLKYGFGAEVGTDPEDADFLKVKVGNTRYDLTAGSGSYMVFAARVARNLSDRANDKEAERNKGLEDNVKRFLRYKLAPVPAAMLNAYQKHDAVGKETSVGKEALGLITPLYLSDLYDAFQQEGAAGLAKNVPGFVGVGVQTYDDSPKGSNFNFDRARERRTRRGTR
jgi:hypothetical protein